MSYARADRPTRPRGMVQPMRFCGNKTLPALRANVIAVDVGAFPFGLPACPGGDATDVVRMCGCVDVWVCGCVDL